MKGCQPVLGCELGRKKEGDGKIEGTHPRSILALKGSGSQSHPCSPHPREVLGCSSRKGHGELQPLRFSPACPETNSCSRTRRGKCSGRRPPGLGTPFPSRRRVRAQAFTCFIFPSLGAGRRGQRSAPTSLLLPQPGSRPQPKPASPVTTTTNQQPPARTHCAGARALARRTLSFRRVQLSSPPRRAGTGLCCRQKS